MSLFSHNPFRRSLDSCFFVVLCVVVQFISYISACPSMCFCNDMSKVVHCSEKGLSHIPPGMPTDTTQLNLNGNTFEMTTLKRINFTRFGLLEHLYLSECNIRAIEVGTFIDLSRLKWLDLSKNRIRDLQDFTFRGLFLDQLFLDGNDGLMLHRDTFNGLRARGVFLHNCGLQEVSLEILRPINATLKSLSLNGNNIKKIGREMLYIFSSLSHLRLHTNPLHCNCEMLWFKQFFDNHQEVFRGADAPSCVSPAYTNGQDFNVLTTRDFRCQVPIFNDIDLLFANENGILRCSASGDPAPTLYWIRPSGERNAYPPENGEMSIKTEGIMKISHVEGVYAGSYECLAMNAGGNVTLTMNVTWPKIERQTIIKYIERDPVYITPAPTVKPTKAPSEQSADVRGENTKKLDGFTMLELVTAVLGTFVATVLICAVVFHFLFRIRWKKLYQNRLNDYTQNPEMYLGRGVEDCDYIKDAVYSHAR